MRDIFYINAYPETNEIVYYGMQFSEFIKYCPFELNRLLLLEAEYYGSDITGRTKFEIVEKEDMLKYLDDNIYSYGNFCWVDFNQKEDVEKLEPLEIAELLYMGHMFKPIKSPFFDKVKNRYAYLSHDDGWFCRLYCRQYSDFKEIMANKIIDMVTTSKRKKIYPLPEEIKEKLMNIVNSGLIIDFSSITVQNNSIEIPIHCIGKFIDMDNMYNNLERNIFHSSYSTRLIYKNRKWIIDYIVEK